MPNQKPRSNAFPAWRLVNGVMNATEKELEESGESCERWGGYGAGIVVLGVIAEVAIAAFHPPYDSFLEQWGSTVANSLVAFGIAVEVQFGRMGHRRQSELQRRSNDKVSAATKNAGEANERAAKADLARAKLESRLQPRSLNQEQWDLIQGLRGKFESVNIGYETDAEPSWFAGHISKAFLSVGISVGLFPRAADVHSFGTLIFDPKGFDGSNPRTAGPLFEIFNKSEPPTALAFVTCLPADIQAPNDVPMIIVGGRFLLPPPWLEPEPKP